MAGKQRYTVKQVIDALNACNGLIYMTAERLGCTSGTVINYASRYACIRDAISEKRGKRVDVGEAALDKAVLNGEGWAIQFLLRTQGKDRGYVERTELTGKDGGAMKVEHATDEQRLAALERLYDAVGKRIGDTASDRQSPSD